MISAQAACSTEQMVTKEISTLVVEFLGRNLQCLYKKERTGGCFVVYNVVEKFQFDLLSQR